ncbi:MAG TPA: ABC transporter permease [Candidatus Limiplasma sp.]|nr:ABC transporter permease [Candidatus Limiplasma sp.]HRX07961.1 ABC transporter permease [Candidatus Limiplasma sp.]
MNNEMKIPSFPKEKFGFANKNERIHDVKFETKPIGYFKDAWLRFRKNKSAVVATVLIIFLLLFALIVPFVSNYTVSFRDGYYKTVLPKNATLAPLGIWNGAKVQRETQAGYDYYRSIGVETGRPAVLEVKSQSVDANGIRYYSLVVDSYIKVGYTYVNLTEDEFRRLQDYQDSTGIQVIYPLQKTYRTNYVMGNMGANFWYLLQDDGATTNGLAVLDENGNFIPNYLTTANKQQADYTSLRLQGDNGGEDGNTWFVYGQRNQSGYKARVDYYEYFKYKNNFEPVFLFGTNIYGQDIFTCLAAGARLSFLLAISVSLINFFIGGLYGAIEGYYGGAIDITMERISDVLASVPFIVVATLFQMHLADKVGVLVSLLFAFVLTGWVSMAARVRMQFYRFKRQEYILSARTLGANDRRLIFKHIYPNAIGTIITAAVLTIPGVIFTESILSYLNIVHFETSSLTSIGTMLANGQGYLSTFPHIILFPAMFISILMISFNLFGNGLRDAFNPSLRGADE